MIESILLNRSKLINAVSASIIDIQELVYHKDQISLINNLVVSPILSNSKEDYLIAESDPEKVSFSNNKDPLSKRTTSSLARYVRRKLEVDQNKIPDHILDVFCRTVKSNLISKEDIEKNIKILSGTEIEDFYGKITNGNALKSCMTGENAYKTRLYAENPEKVNLVVYNNKARALLWTTDNKVKILDRVYPTDGSFESQVLIKWCKLNNFLQKKDLIEKEINHFISLKGVNEFPYIDTFYYGSIKKNRKTIKLSNRVFDKANCMLQSQHGDCDYFSICMFCKKADVNNNFIYYGQYKKYLFSHVCPNCATKHTKECFTCHKSVMKDELHKVEYFGKNVDCCPTCVILYGPKCNLCNRKLRNIFYKIQLDGFNKKLCEFCAEDYYTCYDCGDVCSEKTNPKTVKRNRFYCNYCSRF